jgi:hypothetical protein
VDEGGDVRDGVADAVAGPPALGVEGLVEVPAPRRVDGHEGDVPGVDPVGGGDAGREDRPPRRQRLRLGLDLGREPGGHVELLPHPGERRRERRLPGGDPEGGGGHDG